jgi:hypothetical protein
MAAFEFRGRPHSRGLKTMTIPFKSLILTTSLVLASLASSILAAGPLISFDPDASDVRLIRQADVGGDVDKQFIITAKGAQAVSEVYGNVSGVLFQAAARPDAALQSLPIDLSYALKGEYNAVLRVTIGDRAVTSRAPAWIWAVAAQFADHEATAAITIRDTPPTTIEKRFRQRWLATSTSTERLLWVRYHPAVDDTLIGFLLFTADAMLANAQSTRTITAGLRDFQQYSDYQVAMDPAKSRRAARMLDGLITLESRPGDIAMLNDVDEAFVFTIDNRNLRIGGRPNYHFARKTTSNGFREVGKLTEIFRKNRNLVSEVNPLVYTAAADFAKLVAFFNYVDQVDPDELDEFVRRLKPVLERIPTTGTPIGLVLRTR